MKESTSHGKYYYRSSGSRRHQEYERDGDRYSRRHDGPRRTSYDGSKLTYREIRREEEIRKEKMAELHRKLHGYDNIIREIKSSYIQLEFIVESIHKKAEFSKGDRKLLDDYMNRNRSVMEEEAYGIFKHSASLYAKIKRYRGLVRRIKKRCSDNEKSINKAIDNIHDINENDRIKANYRSRNEINEIDELLDNMRINRKEFEKLNDRLYNDKYHISRMELEVLQETAKLPEEMFKEFEYLKEKYGDKDKRT